MSSKSKKDIYDIELKKCKNFIKKVKDYCTEIRRNVLNFDDDDNEYKQEIQPALFRKQRPTAIKTSADNDTQNSFSKTTKNISRANKMPKSPPTMSSVKSNQFSNTLKQKHSQNISSQKSTDSITKTPPSPHQSATTKKTVTGKPKRRSASAFRPVVRPVTNDDDIHFNGIFMELSEYQTSKTVKCASCGEDFTNEHEIIGCPACGHCIHMICFVDLCIKQRKEGKPLSCPICKAKYFY